MTQKTRYFMLSAAGIVVAGLCTGLFAYYGGLPTGAFSQANAPTDLEYVPADVALVGYADVKAVMSSDIRRRLQELQPQGEKGRQQFEERTGINIETDVDSVVMGVMPGGDNSKPLVIVRGRFNDVKLEALAREHGATVETHQGTRLLAKTGGDNDAGTLAFLAPGVIAVGDDAIVRRAIDTRKSGGGVASNTEMMKLISEIETGTNAWAVGRFDAIANHTRLPDNVASQIPAIEWFSAGGRINGGVSGLFRAEARDDQAAANLRDVVRGFLALAKMQAGSRPELQTMMQSLELGGTGKTVALSFSIPAQVFETLAPQMRQRAQ